MDVAMLIIGVLGLVAASLAAWFAYPAWKAFRAKPDLRLVIEPGPATSAQFFTRLTNDGNGAAVDWIATITTLRGNRIMPRDLPVDGWSDRETSPGWTATWLSRGADDSIGPGLHRELLMTPASGSPVTIEGQYSIRAAGMPERTGSFRVSIDDARNQAIEVT